MKKILVNRIKKVLVNRNKEMLVNRNKKVLVNRNKEILVKRIKKYWLIEDQELSEEDHHVRPFQKLWIHLENMRKNLPMFS